MHLNLALVTLLASLTPSTLARSIPLNTRYGPASPAPHKPDLQEYPIADDCMRAHGLSSLLESNLQTRFFVKSLGMEELQQMLGVYQITNPPYTRTCMYPKPGCSTDDVYGFLCAPHLASLSALPTFEGTPCQSEPQAACDMNLRHLTKQGKPSIPHTYSPNETACGRTGGSAKPFEYIGTETRPNCCRSCTILSTVKSRYRSRLAGTDCAAISHADAVSRISDECTVQSCLATWSVDDDDAAGCVEEQVPDAPLSADEVLRATRPPETRRVVAYDFKQNGTGADVNYVKLHAHAGSPNSYWLGKRDVPASDEADRATAFSPGHIKEDWTRIPDYRRHLA